MIAPLNRRCNARAERGRCIGTFSRWEKVMGSRRAIALAPAEAGCLRVPLAYNGRFPKGIASMSEFLASTFVLAVADLEASRKYYVE